MKIFNDAMTAEMNDDFVIFLIGMRINRPWKFWKWMPILKSMPSMISELIKNPEKGFLNAHVGFGRTIIAVQYWRSTDDLIRYAHDPNAEHRPAWRAFNQLIGKNGDVGIWHETYVVSKGAHESVYVNMPRFGLGIAGNHVPARGKARNARGRLGQDSEASEIAPI